jgi:hypothetical protein
LYLELHYVVVVEIVYVDDLRPVPRERHLITIISDLHLVVAEVAS